MRPSIDPKGNPRTSAKNKMEVRLAENLIETMPDPPKDFTKWQKDLWADIWEHGQKAYRVTDRHVIERYVVLQAQRRELLKTVKDEGMIGISPMGAPAAHPAMNLLDKIYGRMQALEDRLGLTPEARIRLGIASVEHKSAFDRFLEKVGDENQDEE